MKRLSLIGLAGYAYLILALAAYNLIQYLAVYCFQKRNYSLIFPILEADIKVMLVLPTLLRARREIQKRRKLSDKDLRKLNLIFTFKESLKEALATFKRKSEFWKKAKA